MSLFLKFFVFFAGIITTLVTASVALVAVAEILPGVRVDGLSLYVTQGHDYVLAVLIAVIVAVTVAGLSATVLVAERVDD